jgi:hypothetical protein
MPIARMSAMGMMLDFEGKRGEYARQGAAAKM